MYNSSCVAAVSYPAHVMCSQKAATHRNRFIVGTCSLHDSNEISVLQYTESSNHFEAVAVYSHPDQIWAIEASPKNPSVIATSRQANGSHSKSISLFEMPLQTTEDIDSDAASAIERHDDLLELTETATFNETCKASVVTCLKWHSSENRLLSLDATVLSTWDIAEGRVVLNDALILDNPSPWNSGAAAWDPHEPSKCAVGTGSVLQLIDTRSGMKATAEQLNAHADKILDVDFNPNKPLMLLTAGNDRKIKFWDARNLEKPVRTLDGHTHWVQSAKYNPFHDQLVLSGGSDNVVNLWRVASCSSAPWLGSDPSAGTVNSSDAASEEKGYGSHSKDEDGEPPDVKVRMLDQHEDAVYSVAWSVADAWVHCSLSNDGRVFLNHVPSTEKYKILL